MNTDPEIELKVYLHRDTHAARLVSLDGDEGKAQWLPKSRHFVVADELIGLDRVLRINLKRSLAAGKGLLAAAGAGQRELF